MSDFDMELSSGLAAFEAKHFSKAMQLLSPLAEAGNVEAQYRVAVMFQNGLGMAKNEANALNWMRQAADQGHALAQHGLGFMYLHGECVDKDETQAAQWFQRASEQGLAGSQMTLGMMYEQGLGVAKDPEQAEGIAAEKAVIAFSISVDAVGQSLFQQLCASPPCAPGDTLITNRESAGVSRLIFDLAAS